MFHAALAFDAMGINCKDLAIECDSIETKGSIYIDEKKIIYNKKEKKKGFANQRNPNLRSSHHEIKSARLPQNPDYNTTEGDYRYNRQEQQE
jgi:hypothetical protein